VWEGEGFSLAPPAKSTAGFPKNGGHNLSPAEPSPRQKLWGALQLVELRRKEQERGREGGMWVSGGAGWGRRGRAVVP